MRTFRQRITPHTNHYGNMLNELLKSSARVPEVYVPKRLIIGIDPVDDITPEPVVPHEPPDALRRIVFGRTGRQGDNGAVVGHVGCAGHAPSGPVHDRRGCGTPLIADDDQFDRLRGQNRDLLAAAAHTFDHAARLLEGTSAMVILTDKNGTILETVGDAHKIDAGRDINLGRGGSWNEDVVGTNGIGTALSTSWPISRPR